MTATDLGDTQLVFRSAMANLPAGVAVITTDGRHGRFGMTVSAVTSVTDSPPTMAVCINQSASAHDAFLANGTMAINILADTQEDVALIFAGATALPREARFDAHTWDLTTYGVPVLAATTASLLGTVVSVATHGSHSVFFVKIATVLTDPAEGGLVYFQRSFHDVSPAARRAWARHDGALFPAPAGLGGWD